MRIGEQTLIIVPGSRIVYGTIVGESRNQKCWWVKVRNTRHSYHKSFCHNMPSEYEI